MTPGPSAPSAHEAAEIRELVHAFYGRVRDDPLLGPVFEEGLDGRWASHLERMSHFWGAVLHATGGYRGDPVGSHARIPGLGPEHFQRWMELFRATAEETLPRHRAADVTARAARMRIVLERHSVSSSPAGP